MMHACFGRWTHVTLLGLLLLVASTPGCVVLWPSIPWNAPGYGHTYSIVDANDEPAEEGLLLLRSEYEGWITPVDMCGSYEIANGKAIVPWKTAYRAAGATFPGFPFAIITLSNPSHMTVHPLVPGLVPIRRKGRHWDETYRFNGEGPPDVIRLLKADPAVEADYLSTILSKVQMLRSNATLDPPFGFYAKKDRARDLAAVQRARDYIQHRLVELGHPPSQWPIGLLHSAARRGHEDVAELLIANGEDVNAKDNDGRTPLHEADVLGRKAVAELLIAKGADVNAKDNDGETPLYRAAFFSHTQMTRFLIAKGADVNAKDNDGRTPLHRTTSKDVAELLIAKGADVNAKDDRGRTPLHWASRGREDERRDVAAALIAKGADVNAKDEDGKTPLRTAIEMGHNPVAALLRRNGARQ